MNVKQNQQYVATADQKSEKSLSSREIETSFKVAVVQMRAEIGAGAFESNLAKALHLMGQAVAAGASLIVLPETFDFGYDLEGLKTNRPRKSQCASYALENFSRAHGVHMAAGVVEEEGAQIWNRSALFGPEGRIGAYEKIHLFSSVPTHEDNTFARGTTRFIRETKVGRIGLLICYDLRFPEISRALAVDGADILAVSSAWPLQRREAFVTLAKARAIENQAFLVSANQVGSNGAGLQFAGSSMIVDPLGQVLAQADEKEETVLVAQIELAQIGHVRSFMNCFGHRVPQAYTSK